MLPKDKRGWLFLLLLAALGLLVACTETAATPAVGDKLVTFVARPIVADGETLIELGVHNGGNPLPADEAFNGRWELVGPTGDTPRAGGEFAELPTLPGGRETVLLRADAPLEPGAYRLTWGAPDYGAAVVEFNVVDTPQGLQIEYERVYETTDYPPTPDF